MKKSKLKKCPFCGSIPKLKDYSDVGGKPGSGPWMISCRCGVLMTSYARDHHDDAGIHQEIHDRVIEQWNKRI